MSVISKTKAHKLASLLLVKNESELVKEKEGLCRALYGVAEKRIPRDIMAIFNTPGGKEYFYKSQTLHITSKAEILSFTISDPLPSRSEYGGVKIEIDVDFFNHCKKNIEDFEKKKAKLRALKDQLVGLIYSLRTEKKIVEQFPKLKDSFGKKESLVPACIDQIKSQIL